MTKRIDKYETVADGMTITADRIPVETRDYGWGPVKEQKSLFEVRVDGELRGKLALKSGFGTDWQAWSFGRIDVATWDNDRPQHLNRTNTVNRDGPVGILAKFASWTKQGKAPTAEELAAFMTEKRAEEEARKIESEESKRRWKAELAAEKAAAKTARSDRLETLKGMRQRLSGQFSNAEAALIEDLIAEVEQAIAQAQAFEETFG